MIVTVISVCVGAASILVAIIALIVGFNRLTLQFTAMRKSEIDKQVGEVLRYVLEANRLILNGGVTARERVKLLKEQLRVYLAVWEDDPFLVQKTPYLQAAYSVNPGEDLRKRIINHCVNHTHEPGSQEALKCKHHKHEPSDYTEPIIIPVKKKKKKKQEGFHPPTEPIPVVVEEVIAPSILECCSPDGNRLVKYEIEDELVDVLRSLKYATHQDLKLTEKRLRLY